MEKTREVKNTFVRQATILAVASLVVRFLGFLYRLPLTNKIGDTGNAIYSAGYYIYTFFLILSSAGLPAAISKMVSERITLKQYKNAHNVFIVSMMLSTVTSLIGAIMLSAGAGWLSEAISSPKSYLTLITLAPTLFIVGIMAVYRGYFQGMNTMVPTAISQVIEQIFNAVFSILLAYILFEKGIEYAAAGGTAGTGIGALAGLLFILLCYSTFKNRIHKRIKADKTKSTESKMQIAKILLKTAAPIILGTAIFSMTNLIDMKMVMSILLEAGFTVSKADELYGQLTGKYVVLTTLPVSFATAFATAVVPTIASSVILKDNNMVKKKIDMALRITMLISIPCAVGIGVLSDQILLMLFPNYPDGGMLLKIGSISIIFLALAQICTGILQGIGKVFIPAISAAMGSVMKIILNFILIKDPNINIIGAIISTIACYIVASLINLTAISKITKIKPDIKGSLLKPGFASIIMGIGVYNFYHIIYMITNSNSISTLISVVLGICIYGFVMVLIKGLEKEDLLIIPFGEKILRIVEKIEVD